MLVQKKTIKTKSVNKKQKHDVSKSVLVISIITLTIFFTAQISSLFLMNFLKERAEAVPELRDLVEEIPFASTIYDRNGEQLFRLHNDYSNSDRAELNEIKPYTIAAFLAAEDANFMNHSGYDTEAIVRCGVISVTSKTKCGGSTITQQVVKIITNKNNPDLDRKVEELFTASQMEVEYTKKEILEMYFNLTPYGSNIVGIKTAARFYFNKELSKLTFGESVVLSSIVNDPVYLSPTLSSNLELARIGLSKRSAYVYDQLNDKRNIINNQLLALGFGGDDLIMEESINAGMIEEISYVDPILEIKAGHFVNYVIEELQKNPYKYNTENFTLNDLQTGGFKITTTLDYGLQQIAERYTAHAGQKNEIYNSYNAALMTVTPKNGEILTMSGSRSFFGQSLGCDANGENCKYDPEVNVLTSLRSPGSTNKPLGYLIAYEMGLISPGSFLPDIPITFGGYIPKNWDGSFLGTTGTYTENMLRKSRNIPALIVMELIGVENYINKARELGYSTYQDANQFGLSLILGGGDIYPVEHVQAYATFANGGVLVDIDPILKIEDSNGNIVYQRQNEEKRIFSEQATYLLNQSLNRLDTGTGITVNWDWRDVAGKTGTTQNNKDSLLMMYSPDFVTFGWSGNNNSQPTSYLYGWPAFTVAPWLRSYMSEVDASSDYFSAKTQFQQPEGVYWGGGYTANWVIAGKEPTEGGARTVWTTNPITGKSTSSYSYYFSKPTIQNAIAKYLEGVRAKELAAQKAAQEAAAEQNLNKISLTSLSQNVRIVLIIKFKWIN